MKNSNPENLVRRLTGEKPFKTARILAGRNSRVFRANCESGRTLLIKFYLQPTADGRSRLDQEWSALKFMNESGITNIPRPLGFDESVQAAVYSFIHGDLIKNGTDQDIREIITFITRLKKISKRQKAIKLHRAAEACFSPAELVKNIAQRLKILLALPTQKDLYQRLHSFLNDQFSPELNKCIHAAENNFPDKLWDTQLPLHLRTLSPSDFGFHNSLRTDNGLNFVDFEYFGWDDPVKATADFLLHPVMDLNEQQMILFFAGMKDIFKNDENFILRFKTYLPLFRLKWATILLNEFMTKHIERREFAGNKIIEYAKLRAQQLEKAKNFLNKDQKILTALNLRN